MMGQTRQLQSSIAGGTRSDYGTLPGAQGERSRCRASWHSTYTLEAHLCSAMLLTLTDSLTTQQSSTCSLAKGGVPRSSIERRIKASLHASHGCEDTQGSAATRPQASSRAAFESILGCIAGSQHIAAEGGD